ncbi:uncharacterized protein LOC141640874 [Silene latifolia]|uniref:uncharacterized protein LOC141640874 n=1 Tax=Silene latifolia TaxID=37657 RepID=UPI003D77CB24
MFRQSLEGPYTPLPVPKRPWEDVRLDFFVALPRTQRGKDSVMIAVNRFNKMVHFVAYKKTEDAASVAELYLKEILRLHGIPKIIFSKRDTKFMSYFWKTLWKFLKTKILFTELAFNRAPSIATGHSSFEVVYGINLLMPLDLSSFPREELNPDAKKTAEQMLKLHESVRKKIERSTELYKKQSKKPRKKKEFEAGDLVWLHLRKKMISIKKKEQAYA